jgi:hypothetical protein
VPIANVVTLDEPSWRHVEAGASARASYERRLGRHQALVRERRPRILFFGAGVVIVGLIVALSQSPWSPFGWAFAFFGIARTLSLLFVAPAHVRAWDIGAGGEERLGSILASLEFDGFIVMHDLRVPGGRENIDHLLIGPQGIFVVETKTYRGSVRVKGGELYINGRRKTGFFDQVERQLAAVEGTLDMTSVRAFICVLEGDFPWFGRPSARGIDVVPPKRLVETVRSLPAVLEDVQIEHLARRADQRLR